MKDCFPTRRVLNASCVVAQVEVLAGSQEDFRAWDGWVHSRLRQLVMRVEPFVLVRPWPKARPV